MTYQEINTRQLRLRWWAQRFPWAFRAYTTFLLFSGSLFLIFIAVLFPAACLAAGAWLFLEPEFFGTKLSSLIEVTLILLALVLAVPVWRSLSKIEPPKIKGLRLIESEFPELHQSVENLCKTLNAEKPDSILLTPECSIAIISPPRFFGLGRGKHVLRVGLPFFLAFSTEELHALFAHEMAHLSGTLNKASRRIQFRLIVWNQIRDSLSETSLLTGILSVLFGRLFIRPAERLLYASQWAAEFESDQLAATLLGNDEFASSYIKAETVTLLTEMSFWSVVMNGFGDEPAPPADVYHQFEDWVQRLTINEYHEALEWVLARSEIAALDHPPAKARLERLYPSGLPPFDRLIHHVSKHRGETSLLGEKEGELTNLLSRAWYEEKRLPWRDQFQLRQQRVSNLPYWEEVEQHRDLSEHERMNFTYGKTSVNSLRERVNLWSDFHERYPENPFGHFELATALESTEPEQALMSHFALAEKNPWFRRKSLWKAFKLVEIAVDSPERTQFLNRIMELIGELQTGQRELETLTAEGNFTPLPEPIEELTQTLLLRLEEFFKSTPQVRCCWLVLIQSPSLPILSKTVIAVQTPFFKSLDETEQEAFLKLLEPFNVGFVLFLASPLQRFQWRKITRLPPATEKG